MKRILVTGGAGFIGSHLCVRLLNEGCQVVCLDNFLTGSPKNIQHLTANPNFQMAEQDITTPYCPDGPIDEIYNLACPASPIHYQYNPIKTLKTNVLGAINMLDLAIKKRSKLLQASTSEVVLGERQSDRAAFMLRRRQALRGNAVHGLLPAIPDSD